MPVNTAPKLKQFARRLLDYEAARGKSANAQEAAALRVCEKLRGPLGKLIGGGGFRSLLSRALVLAGAEVPWLHGLQLQADGSLKGLKEAEEKLDQPAITEGEVVLVSHLLGLLETFIGQALTSNLLRDIWPELEELNF